MSATLAHLPDDVAAAIQPHIDAPAMELSAIGVQIAAKRDEAKAARGMSGIETTWKECEEAYLGIDDANRHEFVHARWAKPMSMDGPVTTGRTPKTTDHRSTVFLRLTSRYVDAGVAKLTEILLPTDDKAFSFSEMPVPELIAAKEDQSQVVHSRMGAPLTRPLRPGEAPPAAAPPAAAAPAPAAAVPPPAAAAPAMPALPPAPGMVAAPGAAPPQGAAAPAAAPGAPAPQAAPPRVPLTVKDLAIENIEMARASAKAAETRIYDWMVETQYRGEVRKVIADAARIGVGVLKAPTPRSKRVMAVLNAEGGGVELVIKDKIVPSAMWVDAWNIFPDPACGENIHDGDYVFERDHMSARQLRDLKKLPGYIASAIDQVLAEGPNKINITEGDGRNTGAQKGRFEVWYFHGTLTRDEMDAIDRAAGKDLQQDAPDECHVIVTLINDSVVRSAINPLDSGGFPYHSIPWQRRAAHWAGVGVAEQMRTPQKVTNAALRALLNNAGKSAGSQFVIDMSAIRPADGNWTITPDKIWEKTNDGPVDVRQSFMAIQIPNVTQQLMEIITLGERFAEETTSIPLITQGQSGATTPDTFGAAQLQNNNANQLLRSIGYAFDDFITEPVVRQFYEWLLLDPDVPDEEKAEFQIDAHGSAALVERAIQDQSIAAMGNMVSNPTFGIDPKKWTKLFLKSKRLAPEDVMYSEEDQAKLDAAPPVEAPAVTVAKIQADTAMKQLAAKQQTDQQSLASEQQIAQAANTLEGGHVQNDAARVQLEHQRTHVDATIRLHQIQAERDLAVMQYANAHRVSIDQAKVELAKTTMQLQAEKELNTANNAVNDRKHRREVAQRGLPKPPVQVPGRAANGHSFDQSTTP
jgi:hypothetical protein